MVGHADCSGREGSAMSKEAVFQRVSALLRPFAANLSVKDDTEKNFYLEESRSTGKPQMFAAVQLKASYVALHVYPLYVHPELLDTLSPDLRSRMQGKSASTSSMASRCSMRKSVSCCRLLMAASTVEFR
jgi:hypothetical protein